MNAVEIEEAVGSISILNKVESRVGKLYDLTTSYINPDRLPTLQDLREFCNDECS